jgi:hypothetical protein
MPATAITNTKDPTQESTAKELLLSGPSSATTRPASKWIRTRATRCSRDELDKIGKAAAFGSWTASAAMIPISGHRQRGDHRARACPSRSTTSSRTEPPSRIPASSTRKSWERWGSRTDLAKALISTRPWSTHPRQDPAPRGLAVPASNARTGRDAVPERGHAWPPTRSRPTSSSIRPRSSAGTTRSRARSRASRMVGPLDRGADQGRGGDDPVRAGLRRCGRRMPTSSAGS